MNDKASLNPIVAKIGVETDKKKVKEDTLVLKPIP